jgi:hypothetical protein
MNLIPIATEVIEQYNKLGKDIEKAEAKAEKDRKDFPNNLALHRYNEITVQNLSANRKSLIPKE